MISCVIGQRYSCGIFEVEDAILIYKIIGFFFVKSKKAGYSYVYNDTWFYLVIQ